jgi:bacteriorhodopsin
VFASAKTWWLWGVIAAVATGLVTFLGPLQKGETYKYAYYRLLNAIARFESVDSTATEWLLDEHKHAQSIVLMGDPDQVQEAKPKPAPT